MIKVTSTSLAAHPEIPMLTVGPAGGQYLMVTPGPGFGGTMSIEDVERCARAMLAEVEMRNRRY